jgi:uncharacterized protein with von Willebrand factor type A (vWA) domain
MHNAELSQLLNDGATAAESVAIVDVSPLATTPEESKTVLKCDRWTRRTGDRLAAEWTELGAVGTNEHDGNIAADAIETLLSSSPKAADRPADPARAKWWNQLMQSPECAGLRARTVSSPAIAEIAAAELVKQWLQYEAATPEKSEGEGDGDGDGEESPEETVRRIRSTRSAVGEATAAAEDAENCGAGLGLDTSSTVDSGKLASATRRMRKSTNLARIMRMAGRFAQKAAALQKQRTDLPGMEVTGVELSGDLSRTLPLESALVAGAVPELELLAMMRLAQRRSLSYKRVARTPVAMGPIVVSVDESGSMYGAKVEAAKGLALAMASIARAQKRPFLLAGYTNHQRIRVADPTTDGIVAWCEAFLSGGSDLDMPLESIRPHWPKGKIGARADHIIIGDAEIDAATPQFLDDYRAWAKQMNVRTFSIIVGGARPGALGAVSDGGVWCLPQLDLDNPAVDALLSLGPTA